MTWSQHSFWTSPSNWNRHNIWALTPIPNPKPWRQNICNGCLHPFDTQEDTQISCYNCRDHQPFGVIGDGRPGPFHDTDSSSSDRSPLQPPLTDGSSADDSSLSEEGSRYEQDSESEENSFSEEDSESEESTSSEESGLSTESSPFTAVGWDFSSTRGSSSSGDTDDNGNGNGNDISDIMNDMVATVVSWVGDIASNDDGQQDSRESSDEKSNDDEEAGNEDSSKGSSKESSRDSNGNSSTDISKNTKPFKMPITLEERLKCDMENVFNEIHKECWTS